MFKDHVLYIQYNQLVIDQTSQQKNGRGRLNCSLVCFLHITDIFKVAELKAKG